MFQAQIGYILIMSTGLSLASIQCKHKALTELQPSNQNQRSDYSTYVAAAFSAAKAACNSRSFTSFAEPWFLTRSCIQLGRPRRNDAEFWPFGMMTWPPLWVTICLTTADDTSFGLIKGALKCLPALIRPSIKGVRTQKG